MKWVDDLKLLEIDGRDEYVIESLAAFVNHGGFYFVLIYKPYLSVSCVASRRHGPKIIVGGP
jgi:hypothetical protein